MNRYLEKSTLYLFLILMYLITTYTRVIPDGFHPDSLVYMSMARNLAESGSGFWSLHFTDHLFNNFYEHPPLGIYIMSLCFKVFGDTILIDKLFGVFIGLLLMIEIALILRLVFASKAQNITLLATFYFIAFPIVPNTLENNLLEIQVTIFALASIYIYLKMVLQKKNIYLYSFLFTLMLVGAFLVKGPVTIFPLAVAFFYFLLFKEYTFKQMLGFYGLVVLFGALFLVAFYYYEPSHHYFSLYFKNQILASISGDRGNGEHFKLLKQLMIDTTSIVFVSLIIILLARIKPLNLKFSKMFFLFVFIGLSGSLPLEISPKQHDYYIFPALAYFAIALAILFVQAFSKALKRFGGYKFFVVLDVLCIIVLSVMIFHNLHTYKRHENFYHDFIASKIMLIKGASVNVCATNAKDRMEFFNNTEITGNLERYYHVRLLENEKNTPYFLTTLSSLKKCNIDETKYLYIGPKKPKQYLLYKLKN